MEFNFFLLSLCLIINYSVCDIYMHMPRGSNNRWNEQGRNRNNAQRLFDSENNNRGGYNVGSMYFIAGSQLQVQWTNQHSCGDVNTDCDVIIQYACNELIRDGTTTSTIPRNPVQCKDLDCNTDERFGMHEDFYSYKHCRLRERNQGLFTANQKVNNGAIRTRQNRNGNAHGYECSEERDYYPYWAPTMWKDIAVFTNNISRCDYYRKESQNVKERFYCDVGKDFLYQNNNNPPRNKFIPITKAECEEFTYLEDEEEKNGVWTRVPPHGIDAPECMRSHYSRDNHLGNTFGGLTPNYNWTVPDDISEHCVMRIRYNITSGEYNRDSTDASFNNRLRREGNGPDVWTRQGFEEAEEGIARGYKLTNDPDVDVFDESKFKLQVALDTAQFGRTFQDRSHTFEIRERPNNIPESATIHNLNVRGKRGNIVQVFPAVEYDFTPNKLQVTKNDYVHVQWTGSDNNPNNNAGQGRRGTDRSNMILLNEEQYDEGQRGITNIFGRLGRSYPQNIRESNFAGFSTADLINLSIHSPDHIGGDMDELDDAGTYFDLGPRKMTRTGSYNYFCTRNNNFSNRSQKGKLQVMDAVVVGQRMDSRGGRLVSSEASDNSVMVLPTTFNESQYVEMREEPVDSKHSILKRSAPPVQDYASNIITVEPQRFLSNTNPLQIEMKLTDKIAAIKNTYVYRKIEGSSQWNRLEIDEISDGLVRFKSDSGGTFIVTSSLNGGYVAAVVIGCLVALLLIILIVLFVKKAGRMPYLKNRI